MRKINPSIVKFQSAKGNNYIYDVCSNIIFPAYHYFLEAIDFYSSTSKKEIITSLSKTKTHNSTEIEILYNYTSNLINKYKCFFWEKRNKPAIFLSREVFKGKLANVSNLILEVTQNCNFRCKYCSYSGKYYYNRRHNQEAMSLDIAKKSIDYFGSLLNSSLRTVPRKNAIVTFYGGEPLIELDLIRKCVNYIEANSYYNKKELRFSITTNGSLLSKTTLEYIVKKDFILDISLDGPEKIQDTNRIFKNGKGSFKKVWENIIMIKEKYPAYYNDRVKFLITLSPQHNLEDMLRFFNNKNYFNNKNIQINSVNESDTSFFKEIKINQIFYENLGKYYKDYKSYLSTNRKENIPILIYALFNERFSKFEEQTFEPVDKISKFTGTCFPGNKKIFVSADGKYHICERINHNFPIGDYLNGIQFEKVKKIWSDFFKQVVHKCNTCSIIHFCPICFATAGKKDFFDVGSLCDKMKNIVFDHMTDYISILEDNPNAFKNKNL